MHTTVIKQRACGINCTFGNDRCRPERVTVRLIELMTVCCSHIWLEDGQHAPLVTLLCGGNSTGPPSHHRGASHLFEFIRSITWGARWSRCITWHIRSESCRPRVHRMSFLAIQRHWCVCTAHGNISGRLFGWIRLSKHRLLSGCFGGAARLVL